MEFDLTILTDRRFVSPASPDAYAQNVLTEDALVQSALERCGWKVHRASWDDPEMDWSDTSSVLFRSTWDYFDRFEEFTRWRHGLRGQTRTINSEALVEWNVDKHYLADLERQGVRIPPTVFIEQGDPRGLDEVLSEVAWEELVLKPCVSGAGRHTYRFARADWQQYAERFATLLASESMMLQPFQEPIVQRGEVAYVVLGGQFSHAVLKKAKPGDYRVQDDFGGTIQPYSPSEQEIRWVEEVIQRVEPAPIYARVDVIWDNDGQLAVGELELIEPELWFRMKPDAADQLARAIVEWSQVSGS